MAATISPAALGSTTYAITGSNRAVAELKLSFYVGSEYTAFSVSYTRSPGPPALVPQITLVKGAVAHDLLDLADTALSGDATFANRSLRTTIGPDAGIPGNKLLTCYLTPTAMNAVDEVWTVRLSNTGPASWSVTQDDGGFTLLACDPSANITSPAGPTTVAEKSSFSMSAGPADLGGALVPPAAVSPTYTWSYTNGPAVAGFPSTGQTKTFTTPGVYGSRDMLVKLAVSVDTPSSTGFLKSEKTVNLTIKPRTQHLLLVLDRSGSMSGDRWDNAVTASRILIQLYVALRQGVASADRVGVLVFEDERCDWVLCPSGSFSPSTRIQTSLTLSVAEGGLKQNICSHEFGTPGTCTPIGDALIKAMKVLHPLYVEADKPVFNVVLFTDGYENSGSIYLNPAAPGAAGAGAALLGNKWSATVDGLDLAKVKNNMNLHAVGFGATVDDQALNALAGATIYRNITAPQQIKQAFADMVSFSLEAQQVANATSPATLSMPADTSGATNARYFTINAGEHRLALAVTWTTASNELLLARYNQATGTYDETHLPPAICSKHGFISLDLEPLFTPNPVPVTYWRITHQSAGVAQPITDDQIFVYADLHVKALITFDKTEYRTGDEMVIRAQLLEGSEPVLTAQVFVELARPGESLGTFLATNAAIYDPKAAPSTPSDPAPPKQQMLEQILRRHERSSLLIDSPAGIFTDGSNELFDDGAHRDGAANDGVFANVFSPVTKEGPYTFRFYVVGKLKDGTPFNRIFTKTTWAGIRVSPAASLVTIATQPSPVAGELAVLITVTPKDVRGEFLGPFRENEVRFDSVGGVLEGAVNGNPDGSYSQILRYKPGENPTVIVIVQGEKFPPRQVTPEEEPFAPKHCCDVCSRCRCCHVCHHGKDECLEDLGASFAKLLHALGAKLKRLLG